MVARLGRPFVEPAMLRRAMAHRSWCAENDDEESNERLEFLGDAVLGLIVTDHVYRTYTDLPEGKLAQLRAAVVNARSLAEVAKEIGLGDALLLGRGEAASGGREKPSILSDALEAVIGAVYLDGGWDEAYQLVLDLLLDRIVDAAAGPGAGDFKTRLQEAAAQRVGSHLPTYLIEATGPDHAKQFVATVYLEGKQRGRGQGRSKKQAEQAAAREAWVFLDGTETGGDPGQDDDHDGEVPGGSEEGDDRA